MKKFKSLLALTLSAALVAGCSSSGTAAGSSSAATAGTDAAAQNVLYVATDTDLSTMDHHIATDGTSFVAQSLVFSGLTQLNENNEPEPDAADSWDISDDGLVYTFHLNKDDVWSNGTPVTAADFVYGWQRLADLDTASEYAFITQTIHLANADEIAAGTKDVTELGVKAVDDYTLEVTLTMPCDFLLGLMAFPSFFPLNQEFYEAQGDQYSLTPDNLISNGPYVMASWTPGNSYTFTKNPTYFRADEDTDTVDEVDFKFVQDAQSAMLEYESDGLDVVKLTGEMVDAYKGQEGYTSRLTGYLWYLSINFTDEQFTNDNLRKALAVAIDRETICNNVLKDGSIAAGGIIPSQLATGPDGTDYRETNGTLTSYDPTAAAEYYAKAVEELGGDVSFELLYEDTEASKNVAEYIQNNLETNCPGLTVTLNSKPKKTRLELMKTQDYDIALTRWGPDYADPQTYFDLFISTNEDNNSGRYNSATYDATVLEATTGEAATDSAARWNLLLEAEKTLVVDDVGVIPVYQNGGAFMIKTNVTGIEFHSAGVDSYRHVVKTAE